jgi:hypothetical protein
MIIINIVVGGMCIVVIDMSIVIIDIDFIYYIVVIDDYIVVDYNNIVTLLLFFLFIDLLIYVNFRVLFVLFVFICRMS